MQRMTQLDEQGRAYLPKERILLTEQGVEGEAVERLACFEQLYERILASQEDLTVQLAALRKEGKTKTAKFREMMGKKLMQSSLLSIFQAAGL